MFDLILDSITNILLTNVISMTVAGGLLLAVVLLYKD